MSIKQSFILAIKSLKSSKMRAFLTMLGIIIGVGSVIILVSLMSGMTKEITDQFESMGTNLISVQVMGRGSDSRTVDVSDMEQLVWDNTDLLTAVSPSVSVSATVKYENTNLTTTCSGVSEYYAQIRNVELASGRFISYSDVINRSKVAILGSYQQQELFGGGDPIGENIKINGEIFQVIGVLEETQDSMEGGSDDTIILPYSSAMRLGRSRISSYSFQAASKETVEDAMAAIEKKLNDVFGSDSAYMIMSQSQMIEQMDEMTGTMTLVLVGIAGISLLVGGIGIMNIMLVSVTERIREIGIRKSLGARRRDIMGQFLIESATTSAVGGVIGIVFGIVAGIGLGKLVGVTSSPSLGAILIAFSVSLFIGVIFGYLPANKAAKLHPIDALRHE